jgi:homoserine trans-succinylase
MNTAPFFYRLETVTFNVKLVEEGYEHILQGYKHIVVTLKQLGTILNKTEVQLLVDTDEDTITLYMPQEETALFVVGSCEIQVNVYYEDMERDVSAIGKIEVRRNLYKEIMGV